MQQIRKLLEGVDSLPHSQCALSYRSGMATVKLKNGRTQAVEISRNGGTYLLCSRVIGTIRTAQLSTRDLVERLWRRNVHSGVVEFTLDREGRIVGRIEPLADTIDKRELLFYLAALAEECDRLEYLLIGRDEP